LLFLPEEAEKQRAQIAEQRAQVAQQRVKLVEQQLDAETQRAQTAEAEIARLKALLAENQRQVR
jgi:hypothetical protein